MRHAFALNGEILEATSPQYAIGLAIEVATMDEIAGQSYLLTRDNKPFASIVTTSNGVRLEFVDN